MIVIKKGTTSWRIANALVSDEVEFHGEFLYEADGLTPAMVWDALLANVRSMTQSEKDARDAPSVAASVNKADFKTQYAAALTRLDEVIDQSVGRTNAQAQAAVTDLARIVKRHMKIERAD